MRKTGHRYPKETKNDDFGHGRKTLILELNAFANPDPVVFLPVETYIAEFLRNKNPELIAEYELEAFEVLVLDIKRTFTEKLMCITRLSINSGPRYDSLKEKIRHFYDICKMIELTEINEFLSSDNISEYLELVLKDDLINPEFQKEWGPLKGKNILEAELFVNLEEVCSSIKSVLEGDFQTLLYSDEEVSVVEVKSALSRLKNMLPIIIV